MQEGSSGAWSGPTLLYCLTCTANPRPSQVCDERGHESPLKSRVACQVGNLYLSWLWLSVFSQAVPNNSSHPRAHPSGGVCFSTCLHSGCPVTTLNNRMWQKWRGREGRAPGRLLGDSLQQRQPSRDGGSSVVRAPTPCLSFCPESLVAPSHHLRSCWPCALLPLSHTSPLYRISKSTSGAEAALLVICLPGNIGSSLGLGPSSVWSGMVWPHHVGPGPFSIPHHFSLCLIKFLVILLID